MVLTPQDILDTQKKLYEHCKKQALRKGNDYSGKSEDTFRNLRLPKYLGVVQNDMQSCVVQMANKISRLSNFSEPNFSMQVTDESAFDTISDLHNYATYWLMFFEEQKAQSKGLFGSKPEQTSEDDHV